MFEVMCYGDSNTYGYSPEGGARFPRGERWTGVLQEALGASYYVVEEGQNGRTTLRDDPVEGQKNGMTYLGPCLESHAPLDLVVLMLGTNDLKRRFSASASDIAQCVGTLIDVTQRSAAGPGGGQPKVLLMAPPPLAKLTGYAEMLEGGTEKSRKLGGYYKEVARAHGCAFLDTSGLIRTSDLDGIHFEKAEHRKLGLAVADIVRRLLPA